MTAELMVLLGDSVVGRLIREARGALRFVYDEAWRSRPDAYPLSVSMPLAVSEHPNDVVAAYLWGLLPDNELVLDAWAKNFKVSARNPFALLSNVGEDCPGAVRFVRPERVKALQGASTPTKGSIAWIDEQEIAARLRALHEDPSAWRAPADAGHFSLGGAQPKTALYFDGKRWGVPSGRIPTTHILKPGAPHLDGHAENEHFCLALAREVGLPVATSRVIRFVDQVAIVLARYDRVVVDGLVHRVHQEDLCQALGVLPVDKYENAGGPGVVAIASLIRDRSRSPREDVDTFLRALAFNWVIAGTDAHAKNYSILIGSGGIRLAPLYDIASYLPYAPHGLRKSKLAMKIGGKYRLHEIGVHQWTKLARDVGRDPSRLCSEIRELCLELPDQAATLAQQSQREGLRHPVLPALAAEIQSRARACAVVLDAALP